MTKLAVLALAAYMAVAIDASPLPGMPGFGGLGASNIMGAMSAATAVAGTGGADAATNAAGGSGGSGPFSSFVGGQGVNQLTSFFQQPNFDISKIKEISEYFKKVPGMDIAKWQTEISALNPDKFAQFATDFLQTVGTAASGYLATSQQFQDYLNAFTQLLSQLKEFVILNAASSAATEPPAAVKPVNPDRSSISGNHDQKPDAGKHPSGGKPDAITEANPTRNNNGDSKTSSAKPETGKNYENGSGRSHSRG